MADDPAATPLDEPPESDELRFRVPLPPVSLQASGERKRGFTAAIRAILTENFGFIMTSDIQLELTWMLHERLRYEADTAPDIDNILKSLLDGLCGPNGVMVDDNQVQHLLVGWVDWTSEQQSVDVRIRLNDGFWISRQHLEFVQFERAMCWPIDKSLPPFAQRVMIDGLLQMLKAHDKIQGAIGDYYAAKSVMPQQRFFHVSRTTGFHRTPLADYLTQLPPAPTPQVPLAPP